LAAEEIADRRQRRRRAGDPGSAGGAAPPARWPASGARRVCGWCTARERAVRH
jgi:hypothetical protein